MARLFLILFGYIARLVELLRGVPVVGRLVTRVLDTIYKLVSRLTLDVQRIGNTLDAAIFAVDLMIKREEEKCRAAGIEPPT